MEEGFYSEELMKMVAEGGSLENCCGGNSTPGSNPGLSAMLKRRAEFKFLKHTTEKHKGSL
jgi:hypothetical protein